MKKLGLFFAAVALSMSANAQDNSLYDLSFTDIEGNEVSLEQFKGMKILFVNTASECGFTPQYEGLQKLYAKYQDQDFVVIAPFFQFMTFTPTAVRTL